LDILFHAFSPSGLRFYRVSLHTSCSLLAQRAWC
jgi:hypothetical protein